MNGQDMRQEIVVPELPASKMVFSRNAGCSMCPCSPGFVADRVIEVLVEGRAMAVSQISITKRREV